jgi:hypothetical protein
LCGACVLLHWAPQPRWGVGRAVPTLPLDALGATRVFRARVWGGVRCRGSFGCMCGQQGTCAVYLHTPNVCALAGWGGEVWA